MFISSWVDYNYGLKSHTREKLQLAGSTHVPLQRVEPSKMFKVCFLTATCSKCLKPGGRGGSANLFQRRYYQITSVRLNSESTSSRSDKKRVRLINGTSRSQIGAFVIANALRLHQRPGQEEKMQLWLRVSISVQSISVINHQIGPTHWIQRQFFHFHDYWHCSFSMKASELRKGYVGKKCKITYIEIIYNI